MCDSTAGPRRDEQICTRPSLAVVIVAASPQQTAGLWIRNRGALTTSFVLFQVRLPVSKYPRILEGRKGSRVQTDQSAPVHQSLSQSHGHDGKHSYYRAEGKRMVRLDMHRVRIFPVCHGKSQIEKNHARTGRTRQSSLHISCAKPKTRLRTCMLLPVLLHLHRHAIRRPIHTSGPWPVPSPKR
jgi:hypothetical protein